MASGRYLALLRGINVGGNNIIKMADLVQCFEKMGFCDVRTYIQSGNVLFSTTEKNTEKLTRKIEKQLGTQFGYISRVVVLSDTSLKQTVSQAPKGFGSKPDKYRYDVIFLMPPLTPKEALQQMSAKEGVDIVNAGKHALYFSRLISKATQSHLSKIVKLPLYKSTTIRNWNTTTKLLEMMEKE